MNFTLRYNFTVKAKENIDYNIGESNELAMKLKFVEPIQSEYIHHKSVKLKIKAQKTVIQTCLLNTNWIV